MIALDTSAILAILLAEEEAPEFRDLIGQAGGAVVSAGTAVELAAVASRDDDLYAAALTFLNEPFIHVKPVDTAQVAIAAEAYRRYGKGHHAASLNLGDVFAYSLSRERGVPLLFKGGDFPRTDVEPAVTKKS